MGKYTEQQLTSKLVRDMFYVGNNGTSLDDVGF